MPVFLLNKDDPSFPNVELAEDSGLLAVGGDLSEARLLAAYCNGIFPWFQEGPDFFWYAPDPRFVLFPNELRVHKSMRSIFNKAKFSVTLDTCFEAVMLNCASTPRYPHDGTWITDDFMAGYGRLYERGLAHSVEVWQGDKLVGGLYGLSIGKIFFGESMFAQVPNASKTGFITLVRALEKMGFLLIDCQVETPHLNSLGARGIPRKDFQEYLGKNAYYKTLSGKWRFSESGGIDC